MKEHYFLSKKEYSGEVAFANCRKVRGYKVSPKNNISYGGIEVNEMIIVRQSMIERVIKRKIKNHLDMFLKILIDNDSDDDARRALDDIARYKVFVNEKYSPFLDEKYMSLLMKKMNVIERELKQNIVYLSLLEEDEEKENSRKR